MYIKHIYINMHNMWYICNKCICRRKQKRSHQVAVQYTIVNKFSLLIGSSNIDMKVLPGNFCFALRTKNAL